MLLQIDRPRPVPSSSDRVRLPATGRPWNNAGIRADQKGFQRLPP
jgi:hypothetical protein